MRVMLRHSMWAHHGGDGPGGLHHGLGNAVYGVRCRRPRSDYRRAIASVTQERPAVGGRKSPAPHRAEYELVVRGRLGVRVVRALEGLEVTSSGPDETRLRGWIHDQAALHGVIERIRDLGLELTEVHRVA
jgi:hypothetical protein